MLHPYITASIRGQWPMEKTNFFLLSLYVSICVYIKYEGKTTRRMKDTDIFIHTPAFHFVSILHLSRVVLY